MGKKDKIKSSSDVDNSSINEDDFNIKPETVTPKIDTSK